MRGIDMQHLECNNASVILETNAPENSTVKNPTTMIIIKNANGTIIVNMIINPNGVTLNVNADGWKVD
jgi:hypothetical protein